MTKAKAAISIVTLGVALALAGCDSWPDSLNPNKWIEPSDPNANVPGPQRTYPKLSTVPERPPPRNEAAQKKSEQQLEADRQVGHAAAVAPPPMAEGLVADRADARYTDQNLRREQAKPAPPPPPPEPEAAETASAEKPAPAPAPSKKVEAAPAPPPQAAAAPPPAASAAVTPARPAPQQPTEQAALPPAPPPPAAAPPPPAVVAMAPVRSPGDRLPSDAASAVPPRNTAMMWGPPPPDIDLVQGSRAPLRPARPGGAIASVMFANGSSKLSPADEALLRQVAARYQQSGGTVSVVGHASQTAADHNNVRRQIANFSVSMDRATAVARALQRYGVPGEAIAISARIDAVAMNDADGRRADVFLR